MLEPISCRDDSLKACGSEEELTMGSSVSNQSISLSNIWPFAAFLDIIESCRETNLNVIVSEILTPNKLVAEWAFAFAICATRCSSLEVQTKSRVRDNTSKSITTSIDFEISFERAVIAVLELRLDIT